MRKPLIHKAKQQGQAIVLIAILMVALVAALGLAIDGGGMYLLYRDVQNASDSAGLSAAFALCTSGDYEEAAEATLALNGFVHGADGVNITIASPPPSGTTYASAPNADEYIYIELRAEKPSYFIQIVYGGPMEVVATTVSECREDDDTSVIPPMAVVTLRQSCGSQESIRFRGTSDTVIIGGVYVNQTCTSNDSIKTNGSSDTRVDGSVCSQGTINDSPPFQEVDGSPHGDVTEMCTDYPPITDPEPMGLGVLDVATLCPVTGLELDDYNGGTAPPGQYDDFTVNNGTYYLASGIYCVDDDVNWKGTITSHPDGVFIYQYCSSCRLRINAQADVDINAMTTGDYAGIQVYSRSTNTSPGSVINGGAGLQFVGTMYVPFGHCDIVGGSDSQFYGQFICYTADLGGNADTLIQWTPSLADENPPSYGITE